ncbi:RNA polymerase sigma factor RpoE [Labilithrix luteola]|uniref:RNA polymerase sigma factor RpoE n=1 Tax=Labilithrix luteola TaxID=1391654 RepID=A0A0K1PN28_9BACT|nr:RNA polymerase sigma factor [Labilithrix luteola]AKU94933.1 RNA polymerase sigma factor RpoE [Labilithrix luteola]
MPKLLGHILAPAAPAPVIEAERTASPRFTAGDAALPSASFDAFYRDTWRFVWRSLGRLGAPQWAMEDLFQEVFLVVHRRLPDYEPPSENADLAARVWVFRILRFVLRSHRRGSHRKGAPFHSDAIDLDAVPGATETPHVIAERSERVQLLYDLLDTLDSEKREIFVLVELEGLTARDAASALALNERTARTRLNAARADFKKAFERHRARDEWRLK